MKTRRAVLSVLALTLAFSMLTVAIAGAAPASFSPAVLKSIGFENATTDNLTDVQGTPIAGDPDPTAFWGRITNSKRTGSYGLWCAGSVYPGGEPSTFWPAYPEWTRGQGELPLLELEDYYSATLDFWYVMPTRGVADDGSFGLFWNTEPPGLLNDFRASFDLAPQWTKSSVVLTHPASRQPLSREPGRLWFRFNDKAEGGAGAKTGQGPTIDDIAVTVYKYGPVRDLAATPSATALQLSWLKPYRSTTQNTVEERSVAYRVWRTPTGQDAWQEVTDPRTTNLSFDDTTTDGTVVDYAVQAWDTGTGTGYGQHVRVNGVTTPDLVGPVVEATVFPDYYRSRAEIDISASDVGSGVKSISYKIDGGSTSTTNGSSAQAVVTSLGSHTITYWAEDNAGNESDQVTENFRVNAGAPPATRVDGVTRYLTAVALSQEAFAAGSVKNIIVASGAGFPDALSASGLAGAYGSPILLVPSTGSVPSGVTNEIARIAESGATVWVIGGTVAVSNSVANQLDVGGVSTVSRIQGSDRYATAAAVAARVRSVMGSAYDRTAFVASGLNFPDALAASPIAYAQGMPVLLTDPSALTPVTATAITQNGVENVVIAGGTGAVSARVEQQIEIRSTVKDVDRWAGSDRYNTARVVAQNAESEGWARYGYVGVASGENYPDALAGGPVAGQAGGVMVLTQARTLPSTTSSFLSTNKLQIQSVQVYGGPVAISNTVIGQINNALK